MHRGSQDFTLLLYSIRSGLEGNLKLFSSKMTKAPCDIATVESTLLSRKVPLHIELLRIIFNLHNNLGILSGLVKTFAFTSRVTFEKEEKN